MSNNAKPGIIVLVCGLLGFIMAAIEQLAFDSEFVFHLYVTTAELPGLQILTILVFMLFGGTLAAIT